MRVVVAAVWTLNAVALAGLSAVSIWAATGYLAIVGVQQGELQGGE